MLINGHKNYGYEVNTSRGKNNEEATKCRAKCINLEWKLCTHTQGGWGKLEKLEEKPEENQGQRKGEGGRGWRNAS